MKKLSLTRFKAIYESYLKSQNLSPKTIKVRLRHLHAFADYIERHTSIYDMIIDTGDKGAEEIANIIISNISI